jgi:hypothetical protein
MAATQDYLKFLVDNKLTFEQFRAQLKKFGCHAVGPGEIRTADLRLDGTRCFVTIKDGCVIEAHFG